MIWQTPSIHYDVNSKEMYDVPACVGLEIHLQTCGTYRWSRLNVMDSSSLHHHVSTVNLHTAPFTGIWRLRLRQDYILAIIWRLCCSWSSRVLFLTLPHTFLYFTAIGSRVLLFFFLDLCIYFYRLVFITLLLFPVGTICSLFNVVYLLSEVWTVSQNVSLSALLFLWICETLSAADKILSIQAKYNLSLNLFLFYPFYWECDHFRCDTVQYPRDHFCINTQWY